MKSFLALILVTLTLNSYASMGTLSVAMNSPALKALEKTLKTRGFQLRSVEDRDAGEVIIRKDASYSFIVGFKKSEVNRSNYATKTTVQTYVLEMDLISGTEEITIIGR